jgi:hypothetical protein
VTAVLNIACLPYQKRRCCMQTPSGISPFSVMLPPGENSVAVDDDEKNKISVNVKVRMEE